MNTACPKCKGWGKVRYDHPVRGEYVRECTYCKGSGKKP